MKERQLYSQAEYEFSAGLRDTALVSQALEARLTSMLQLSSPQAAQGAAEQPGRNEHDALCVHHGEMVLALDAAFSLSRRVNAPLPREHCL